MAIKADDENQKKKGIPKSTKKRTSTCSNKKDQKDSEDAKFRSELLSADGIEKTAGFENKKPLNLQESITELQELAKNLEDVEIALGKARDFDKKRKKNLDSFFGLSDEDPNPDNCKEKIIDKKDSAEVNLPVLALRNVICFPNSIVPLSVGRSKSIVAIEKAMKSGRKIFLSMEKEFGLEEVSHLNLFKFGVVAKVLQKIKLPNNALKILVDVESRAEVIAFEDKKSYINASLKIIEPTSVFSLEMKALSRNIIYELKEYLSLKKISIDTADHVLHLTDINIFADTIASLLQIVYTKKQEILETINLKKRLELILMLLLEENEILKVEQVVKSKVRSQLDKSQKDYYLNEQMKVIRKELGDGDGFGDLSEKYEKLKKVKNFPLSADTKIKEELKKLQYVASSSGEAMRTYLDFVLSLPWGTVESEKISLFDGLKCICKSHYGLDKVKLRILEYMAAQINSSDNKGAILCLHGSPGVGKTTLVKSIANAMGRKYAKISLGGVRDEAEIRGHRKTYVAAMPGKIIQSIKKVGVDNPVILLDEIDKLAHDYRGDPESAMLEVLDPEQNSVFQDHYLEIEYDLSKVVFIATTNSLNIRSALLDRLEVVNVPSYLFEEKLKICKNYVIPKKLKENNVSPEQLEITDNAISELILYYTREAGVRELSRLIGRIVRKSLIRLIMERDGMQNYSEAKSLSASDPVQPKKPKKTNRKNKDADFSDISDLRDLEIVEDIVKYPLCDGKMIVDDKDVETLLGPHRYESNETERKNLVGVVNGLAYTEVGGEVMLIEVLKTSKGKGELKSTGKLGDVMKESAQAAITYVKSNISKWGLSVSDVSEYDFHFHVPAGAVPKDGPSAGVAFCIALISLLTNTPIRNDVAMTGEISLRGRTLPIGGLREKLVAAISQGIKKVCIPLRNQKDLSEIPSYVKDRIKIIPCEFLEDVLKVAVAKPISTKKKVKV